MRSNEEELWSAAFLPHNFLMRPALRPASNLLNGAAMTRSPSSFPLVSSLFTASLPGCYDCSCSMYFFFPLSCHLHVVYRGGRRIWIGWGDFFSSQRLSPA